MPARCNNRRRIFIYSLMNTMVLPATRSASLDATSLAGKHVIVDWARNEVRHRDGRRCELSTREADLLACLARKPGAPVSRAEILAQVWKLDPRRTVTRTIDMHISLLRKKLGDIAKKPMVLLTVHGVGYMLHGGGNGSSRTLQFENERGLGWNDGGLALVNG
jgi:DNA-binding response OmpR family regulator